MADSQSGEIELSLTAEDLEDPDLADKLVARAIEQGMPEELAEDVRGMVEEQLGARASGLLLAVRRAIEQANVDGSRTQTLERLGIDGEEWLAAYDVVAHAIGCDDSATKRTRRIAYDAMLFGFLLGMNYQEPTAAERPASERTVIRRRRHARRNE